MKALAWYSLAAKRGLASAAKSIESLQIGLTSQQIEQAQAFADELNEQIEN